MAVLTSEGRILFWETEFQQVGQHGQDFTEEDAPPTMLSARPTKGEGLVDLGEGQKEEEKEEDEGVGDMIDAKGLSLADTVAPHWFTPPNSESHDMSHDYHMTYVLQAVHLCMICSLSN